MKNQKIVILIMFFAMSNISYLGMKSINNVNFDQKMNSNDSVKVEINKTDISEMQKIKEDIDKYDEKYYIKTVAGSCITNNQEFNNCNKIKTDDLLPHGTYYFSGENNTQFLKEINLYVSNDTSSLFNFNQLNKPVFWLVVMIFMSILNILLIMRNCNMKLKKLILYYLEGNSKIKIANRYIKKQLQDYIIIATINLIIFLVIYYIYFPNVPYMNILVIGGILLVIILSLVFTWVYILLKLNMQITSIINNQYQMKIKGMLILKSIILIAASVMMINFMSWGQNYIKDYYIIKTQMPLVSKYGQFGGTSAGNDTMDYFTSSEYQDNVVKASEEIIKGTNNYLFTQIETSEEANIDELMVNNTYAENHKLYDSHGQNVLKPTNNVCSYYVPSRYYQTYKLPGECKCKEEQKIKIANNQKMPSYNFTTPQDILLKDAIVKVFPTKHLETMGYTSYDNIMYPVDANGKQINQNKYEEILKNMKS